MADAPCWVRSARSSWQRWARSESCAIAINDGVAQGNYTLIDRLPFGTCIDVKSSIVTSAPEGVTPSGTLTGPGDEGHPVNVVATDVPLMLWLRLVTVGLVGGAG